MIEGCGSSAELAFCADCNNGIRSTYGTLRLPRMKFRSNQSNQISVSAKRGSRHSHSQDAAVTPGRGMRYALLCQPK